MSIFRIEIPSRPTQEQTEAINQIMDRIQDSSLEEIKTLALELNVDETCAADVWYLRQRSRWTSDKETELIKLYRLGNPPNIMEFGH